jgi:hypothetical protein
METVISRTKYTRGLFDHSKLKTFDISMPIYLTDLKRCLIGDGITVGGIPMS